MKLWSSLANAVAGWQLILQGDAGWRERFTLSTAGFITALAIFVFTTFLAVAIASMSIGMPSLFGVVAAMIVLALPITAVVVTLVSMRTVLKSTDPIMDMLVPATYALTAFLVLEGVVAVVGGPVVLLSWVVLGYLLYQLARVAAGWNLAIAIGFGILTVLLLVAMRLALYMLTNPAGSPI